MWLVDNYKLFFLRVPKTGSHTIYRTFNGGRGYKGMHGTMGGVYKNCLLYTSPSPRDRQKSRMPSSA